MDDADASRVLRQGRAQEVAERGVRCAQVEPMQIELAINAEGAAPQLPHQLVACACAAIAQFIARLDGELARREPQALFKHQRLIGAREPRARRRLRARRRVAADALERHDIAYGCAEELGVVARHGLRGGRLARGFSLGLVRHRVRPLLELVGSDFEYSVRRPSRQPDASLVKILVSNDDGYRADGLRMLAAALTVHGEITVVAPDRNRSGASNSLTLDVPLRVTQAEPNTYYVTGTPTDCVHLAISGLFEFEHDMVVSGINDGPNLGDDVLYSGTVAAAMEGRFLGLPAIALSLCTTALSPHHFDTAARVASELVARVLRRPLDPTMILNVNIPDRPYAELRGTLATRLGYRHRAERVVQSKDPKGRTVYWVGPAGPQQDAGPGTDFDAIAQGYVSVTPLQLDLTRHPALGDIGAWLGDVA